MTMPASTNTTISAWIQIHRGLTSASEDRTVGRRGVAA